MANALALAKTRYFNSVFVFDPSSGFEHWPESTARDLARLSDLLGMDAEERPTVIVYQPENENVPDEFEACWALLENKTGYVLLVDECHWVQTPNWAAESLRRLVRKPTQYGVLLMQTCHAPTDTWGRTRSLATDWYMFKLTRSADLEAVERECGEQVARIVSELPAVHSPALPGERRVYVHYQVDSAEYQVIDAQQEWYVDLGPLPIREEELIGV
jgi:hypothetical protein